MSYPKKLLNDYETVAVDLHPHWWHFAEPVSALGGYLARAREIAAGIEAGRDAASGEGSLTDVLENLRWFPLPR